MLIKKKWALLAIMLVSAQAQADTEVKTEISSARGSKKIGFYLGVASEPYPSIFSLNVAYNVLDNLRLSAGAGTVVFGSSYGVGAKYLFSPTSAFSPVLGLNAVRTNISDFLSGAFGLQPSPDDVVWSSTVSGGVDWQTQVGFNLGVGVNWMWLASPSNTIGTKIFPYLNIGWFF